MEPNFLDNSDPNNNSFGSQLMEFLQTLVVFAAIATVIFLFIAQPHKVSGPSMYPTFHDGDYIITDKITYRFENPQRGDVIVFEDPLDHSTDFIKRIIGLPGEKVMVANGHVYINDKLLNEPYIAPDVVTTGNDFLHEGEDMTIPSGKYIVMGDNREHSSDSRAWGFVKRGEILGRVIIRYWPPQFIGLFPGAYSHYNLQIQTVPHS